MSRPTPGLLRAGLVAVAAALVAVVVAAVGPGASAQVVEDGLPAVTAVDARTSTVEVALLADDPTVLPAEVTVAERGQDGADDSAGEDGEGIVPQISTARDERRPTELVFVVDIDNRTAADGSLDRVRGAIATAVRDLPSEVRVGLVTAGAEADVVTRLTANPDRLIEDLATARASRGAALFDAVELAGRTLSDTEGAVRTVVVFAAGTDSASEAQPADAAAQLVQAGAQLVTVRLGSAEVGLDAIQEQAGGATVVMAEPETAAQAVDAAVAVAADRLLVSYPSNGAAGERRSVTLTLDEHRLELSYPSGVLTTAPLQLRAEEGVTGGNLSFFGAPIVLYLSVILAFAAITLATWSLGSMYAGGQSTLDSLLSRYAEADEQLEEAEVQEMLVQSALVQRAVDFTESFAERRGFLARVEDLLERANLPVRAGEALFFLVAATVVVTGLVFVIGGSVFFAALAGLLTSAGGFLLIQFLAARRLKIFEAQLPDTLQLLAGTLRAGYSLPQGLDAVADEIADPMGHELRRAITEAQLGRELEEALTGIADRLDSPDFAWAVMAIGIQREVGGNLNELLMTVSETMIQRERLRREVNALTAEGRVSAAILSFLPPGLGFVLWVMNPEYVGILFSRTLGWILLGVATVSALIGLVWMKKVITIDA